MQKSIFLSSIALLSMVSITSQSFLTVDKTLWHGSIKFPSDTKINEPIRVYYTGDKAISCEIDNVGHQVCFTISEYKMRNVFHLIVVDSPDRVSEHNTVQYFKVPQNRPYKLYELVYTPNKDCTDSDADLNQQGTWLITQKRLGDDMRIPDSAIIVCYHAHLIKSVEGGNAIELPKVVLDEQMLKKLTAEELHDASVQFVLSALDFDSFHSKPDTQIKTDFARKTVMALTA